MMIERSGPQSDPAKLTSLEFDHLIGFLIEASADSV